MQDNICSLQPTKDWKNKSIIIQTKTNPINPQIIRRYSKILCTKTGKRTSETPCRIKKSIENYLLRLYSPLLYLLLLLPLSNKIEAQEPQNKPLINERLARAEMYLKSFKNDSAIVILESLSLTLSQTDEFNSLLGLQVQVRLAEALEREEQDERAIEKLLHIVETSKKKKAWTVLGDAYLSLARLQEKIERAETCLSYLRQAEFYINKYKLDTIYPRFAIRISSYHRIFGDRDSSLYYAQEVLRTARPIGQIEHEGTGHLLMGMLLSKSDYEKAIEHYKRAGVIWLEREDYNGYSYIQGNLSKLYWRNNQFEKALLYNDSMLVAAQKLLETGHASLHSFYSAYQHRGAIYNELGVYDSAWVYINKGYEMELEEIAKVSKEKVIEIDARYNDEKKVQKIKEQDQQIQYERERGYWLLGLFVMFLIFTTALIYYYFRLRKANNQTQQQALAISKKNEALSNLLEQQIILQGELHHRVKNNLQIIISLIELQMEDLEDPVAQKNMMGMMNRIHGMANIHDLLHQKDGVGRINLYDYVNAICQNFNSISGNKHKIELHVEKIYFNQDTLMPLGIIFHELITNSIKYAISSTEQLIIKIKIKASEDGYRIQYRDNGPGFPNGKLEEREGGLGFYLVKSMVRQLNGGFDCKNDGGVVFDIYIKEKNKI